MYKKNQTKVVLVCKDLRAHSFYPVLNFIIFICICFYYSDFYVISNPKMK